MMIYIRRGFLLLLLVFINIADSNRKYRRYKELKRPEAYQLYPSDTLPSDIQVTTYLYRDISKRFYYQSAVNNCRLSVTISSCSAPVEWTFESNDKKSIVNVSDKFDKGEKILAGDMFTSYLLVNKGLYILQLLAQATDTYVHIYLSTEKEGPEAILRAQGQKLKIVKRQRRKGVTVRWQPSLVDPQSTNYCVVVNDKKNHRTLCAAQASKYGIPPPPSKKEPMAASQTVIDWQPPTRKYSYKAGAVEAFPVIAHVGRSTQYTMYNLKQGKGYYFDVFATDKQNNFTYLYGSSFITFDGRIKPITLKNGVPSFVNLKKYDGKVVFRFKISRHPVKQVHLFFTPCGSEVNVEVSRKGNMIAAKRNIMKYDNITIDSPVEGSRYYIKVLAVGRDAISKTKGIEVLAFFKPLPKASFPIMPVTTALKEYKSLKTCDSVTIGWLPIAGNSVHQYCVTVNKEEQYLDSLFNQCPTKNDRVKSNDYVFKYCKDITHGYKPVIVEKINYLKPGKNYMIQLTVKKPKGQTLSYDLLHVHTLPTCRNFSKIPFK